jgi:hypothetical protein
MLNDSKVLVSYNDISNNLGKAVILNVSNNTITSGTPFTFINNNISDISTTVLTSTKVLVAYKDT